MHPERVAGASAIANLGALVPGDGPLAAERIRRICHLALAVTLELIGVAAICSAGMHRGVAAVARGEGDGPAVAGHVAAGSNGSGGLTDGRADAPGAGLQRSARRASSLDRYHEARVLVCDARIAPTYRALQTAMKVGQATSRKLLADLHAEGLLRKAGRRYELVA
jgi:hypothetical protein